ncbi:MAG TPA: hypothetical protein VFT42_05375 [Solirubrobacteraceae bacterium]|nr:hypothetical protein [Solirubrobacteraceae bacterium]
MPDPLLELLVLDELELLLLLLDDPHAAMANAAPTATSATSRRRLAMYLM